MVIGMLITACSGGRLTSAVRSYTQVATTPGISIVDGYIPTSESVSPFDMDHPAIANLDPVLRKAVQQATRDAAASGVEMYVTDGWRSARYQQSLLEQAVLKYGSRTEAAKWVATPEKSKHVTGDAVDIGPTNANSWLSQRGAAYGLCQTYANEMWHFELATKPGGSCPRARRDATVG